MARKRNLDEVTKYALDVVENRLPACSLQRAACRRHLEDLKSGKNRGLFFDIEEAVRIKEFFSLFLRHSKGEWANSPFILSPWQEFILGSLFGWKRSDGLRRYRTAYIEVPRKNGKSSLAAGVGLYLFLADGEPGAEVYTAATHRDQARIVHSEAVRMVKASADLRRIVTIFKDNLSLPESAARYVPLGADSDTMDGLNVHGAIIDELHAHKTRGVVDVLETATGARRQPMIFEITTAGWDQQSICREHHDYSRSVLSGTISDDSWFAFIASADEGDNWQDPDTWRKANPNYEITVKPDDLFRKAEKAAHLPAAQNTFKRLHLNLWTQQADRWINLEQWDSNNLYPIKEEDLAGHICYGGLDLASVSDLAAWVMVFPMEGGEYNVLARFWCPVEKLTDSRNRYREQYQVWAKKGWLRVSPGPTIDYSQVREQILEDSRRFRLVDLNVDRLFQAHQIAGELQEAGLTVFGMGQGFMSMAAPMRELERLILARQLNHGGNPILRWMADNVAVKTDPAGNRKPDKASSQGKIDGIVALVMALDRACRYQVQTPHYEERGLWLI